MKALNKIGVLAFVFMMLLNVLLLLSFTSDATFEGKVKSHSALSLETLFDDKVLCWYKFNGPPTNVPALDDCTLCIDTANNVVYSWDGGTWNDENLGPNPNAVEAGDPISGLTNDAGYITSPDDADNNPTNEIQDLSPYQTIAGASGWDQDVSDDFSGDYNDLTNQPTIPTLVSQLTNDAGYLTASNTATIYSNPTAVVTIGTDGNMNNTPIAKQLPLTGELWDDIGITVASNNMDLPAGNYTITWKLKLDANAQRTNFKVQLRDGTTLIDEDYGGFYGRNANGHDDTGDGQSVSFIWGGGNVNLATLREANTGDVNLDGGQILIEKRESVTVLIP